MLTDVAMYGIRKKYSQALGPDIQQNSEIKAFNSGPYCSIQSVQRKAQHYRVQLIIKLGYKHISMCGAVFCG